MPKTDKTKTKVTITLDRDLVQTIKQHNLKLSTLCNNVLSSLFSKPYSLLPLQGEDRRFNSGQAHQGNRDKRQEICDTAPIDLIYNSKLNLKNQLENRVFSLKSMYFKTKSMYFIWGENKFTSKYIKTLRNRLDLLFKYTNGETPKDILNCIELNKLETQYTMKGIRNFLNYLEEKELIEEETLIIFRNKIKIKNQNFIDTFVPTKSQIEESLSQIKEIYPEFEIYYKIILESGCRFTELKHFILNFDKKNIEEWDDEIILYRNFYIRGNKSSYYIFISKLTYDGLKLINNTNVSNLDSFQDKMSRNKEIISLKYLRKYQMQLMLENNIPLEVCDFIQGRGSSSVGFNHYTNKKVLAIREYKKIINLFI